MQKLRFLASGPEDLFHVDGLRQCSDSVGGRMALGAWATGSDGRPAVGSLGVLTDEVLGYSLMASLPQGAWSISTEIWVDVVGDLATSDGTVVGHATPVQEGSYSTGELRDGAGRLLALCRQRGRRAPFPEEFDAPPARAVAAGGSLDAVLGLRARDSAYVMEARSELMNPRGMLHGGVSLAASEVAATCSRVEHGCDLATTSVHIVHTRGVPVGVPLVFHVEPRHTGRTLWVTEVIGTVDGRTCTVATVAAQE